MARSMWKGAISFGLVHIPVEMYPAASDQGLDLTMLDRRDFAPIGFKRYNKGSGKEVTWDNIVKGYEYSDGEYVVLSDEFSSVAYPVLPGKKTPMPPATVPFLKIGIPPGSVAIPRL